MVLTIGGLQLYKGDKPLDSPRLRVFKGVISDTGTARGTPTITLQSVEIKHSDLEQGSSEYYLKQGRRDVRAFALPHSPEFPGRPTSTLVHALTDNRSTHLKAGLPFIVGAVLERVSGWQLAPTSLGRMPLFCRVVGPGPKTYVALDYEFKSVLHG
jgi:hypothetical protein